MQDKLTQRRGKRIMPAEVPPAVAGVLSGLIAGAAYLAAQMTFTATLHGGKGWEPLQRIAAILLGPDAAPPPADLSLTIVGIGLLIHFGLAMAYGRVVEVLARPAGTAARAAVIGGVVGLGLFVLNFWWVAPEAFPWFEASRNFVTAADHVLFGALAAVACFFLRRR